MVFETASQRKTARLSLFKIIAVIRLISFSPPRIETTEERLPRKQPTLSEVATEPEPNTIGHQNVETTVSGYDMLNAFLISAIMMFGAFATILFLIWYTSLEREVDRPVVVETPFSEDSGDSKPEGVADDELEPGVEDFPEIETPQLAMALEAVTDAVSAIRANTDAVSGSALLQGAGRGAGSREGGGDGNGKGIPEYKRWVINYESTDIDQYADQLSFFNLDIGVVKSDSNAIYRVRDAGGNAQLIESDREKEQKSLRFSHKQRRMKRWDEVLSKRAGANIDSSILCQFYPESTRKIIRQVEAEALAEKGRKLSDVRQTILKIQPAGDGFEFVVLDFNYRL